MIRFGSIFLPLSLSFGETFQIYDGFSLLIIQRLFDLVKNGVDWFGACFFRIWENNTSSISKYEKNNNISTEIMENAEN